MEVTDNTRNASRKRGARLSPRNLSALTKQLIVDEFRANGDIDAVAKAYKVPVQTVNSVLHWHALRHAPQPDRGSARPFVVQQQRSA